MRVNVSAIFMILLIVVMCGVVFGVQTNSRDSILVKEMFYVAGGSIASMMAAVFVLMGKPFYKNRFSPLTLGSIVTVLALMVVLHFAGTGSTNGPFTFMMLLSLTALTVSSLLFVNESHVKMFTLTLLGASFLVFVYAVMQWQGIYIFSWDAALTRSGRSTGSFGNPNLLGGFASAMIPLGAACIFSEKKYSVAARTALVVAFTTLATAAVVASGTRGSLIGVAAGSGVILVWSLKKSLKSFRKAIPAVILFVAVAAAVAVPMSSRLSELNPTVEKQGTLQVRSVIWSGALSLFRESPLFGHGPGSFQILFPRYRSPEYSILGVSHNTLHAHCEYLEILVDLGITGLLLWAAAAWGMVGYLKKASLFRAGAFAGMVAMLAEALVSVHLRWPPTAWLFATLAMIYLSGNSRSAVPGGKMKAAAWVLVLVSIVLATGLFVHYIPLSRTSILVFRGKDIFLARTENAMNNGYSAANHWVDTGNEAALNAAVVQWQNAVVFADSAVAYSKQATETYPYNLGGWYALGSAHLTRYMVMVPPVPAMRSALDAAGVPFYYPQEETRNELILGMAAYDSLVTMAPNYAEVHNNMALGYANMGLPGRSFDELYKSFRIHAHRRNDYFNQVAALIAIYPNSVSAATLYFHYILLGFDVEAAGNKLEEHYNTTIQRAWCVFRAQSQNQDTLKSRMYSLLEELLPAEHAEILENRINSIDDYSPYTAWENGDVLSMNTEDALSALLAMSDFTACASRSFPTVLQYNGDFYTRPAEILFQSVWDRSVFDAVMNIYLWQIVTDRHLDDAYSLLCSERFADIVDPAVAERINQVRAAVGGSRTATRNSLETPWLSGSLPALVSDSLHSRMASDSLNSIWYEMELEMTFLIVSSYWWNDSIFVSGQNQYLLGRVFYCRDKIRELKPDCWSATVSMILANEIDRICTRIFVNRLRTVNLLKDDLVSGAARITESP
jgi:O-antigen ligase